LDLKSKTTEILTLGNPQINLVFRSLNRIFARDLQKVN